MRKTIRKGQLKRLVESAMNELDWKTYMNAAKANAKKYGAYEEDYYDEDDDPISDYEDEDERAEELLRRRSVDRANRTDKFVDAARNAYKKKYGSKTERDYIHDYGYADTQKGEKDFEATYPQPFWEDYEDGYNDDDYDEDDKGRWVQPRVRTNFEYYYKYNPEVDTRYEEDDDGSVYSWDRDVSDYTDDEMPPEWKDVANYNSGESKYVKGKGWTNESRNRRRTIKKSQLKRLVEGVLNEIGDTPDGRYRLGKMAGNRYRAALANGNSARISREKMDGDDGSSPQYQHWNSNYNISKKLNDKYLGQVEKLNGYIDNKYPCHTSKEQFDYAKGFNDIATNNESRKRKMVNNITESVIRKLRRR